MANTLRRSVFQRELTDALAGADCVLLAEVYRQDKIPIAERLNVEQLREELTGRGIPAELGGGTDQMVETLTGQLRQGDVVVVMSNGGFGGLPRKLLHALKINSLTNQPAAKQTR